MLKPASTKFLAVVLFATFVLAACDKSEDESGSSSAYTAADSLLNYVPANSPYVLASLQPLPDDVVDKLEPKLDRMLAAYRTMLREIVVIADAKAPEENADREDLDKVAAVVGELESLLSVDGLREAGLDRHSTAVVYGNGLLPVIRVKLSDDALFDAALSRIEEKAGEKMPVASISGNPVRYVDADGAKILVSILDKQLVIAVAPMSFDDEQLGQLLGFTRPAANLADAGTLQDIARQYQFEDYFVGYLDIAAITGTLTGTATGLDAALLAMLPERPPMSDVCQAEIRSLAGIAPRMVTGYTEVSAARFGSQAVIELRDDIANGLAGLVTVVPGLGGDLGGMMSFGLGVDVKAMRAFYEAQLDALEKEPYECEYLADLQAGVAGGRAALQQPAPPMVYDFRGFVGVIQDIEGLDLGTQTPPTSVDGQFLLAMDNAPALVALGAMMSPDIAGLGLEPDGKPVKFDLPLAQMLGGEMFVAMTDDALAVSVGEGGQAKIPGMLKAESSDNGTFVSFSMDAARYYAFLGEAVAAAEHDDDSPMTPNFQAATQDLILAIADIYERMSVDIRFTENGIVIDSTVTLSD